MKTKIKLILLDLDGVIIDSKQNMRISWESVRKITGTNITFKDYFKLIGLPFEKILIELLIKKNFNFIKKIFKKTSISNFNKIKLYPGVKSTLNILKKKKINLGIVTSKDRSRTLKILNKFKIDIKNVVTPSKKLRGKPYPDQLKMAIRKSKSRNKNTIYVGDMIVDFKSAQNARVKFVYASYGYGKFKKKYKFKINKFSELIKII